MDYKKHSLISQVVSSVYTFLSEELTPISFEKWLERIWKTQQQLAKAVFMNQETVKNALLAENSLHFTSTGIMFPNNKQILGEIKNKFISLLNTVKHEEAEKIIQHIDAMDKKNGNHSNKANSNELLEKIRPIYGELPSVLQNALSGVAVREDTFQLLTIIHQQVKTLSKTSYKKAPESWKFLIGWAQQVSFKFVQHQANARNRDLLGLAELIEQEEHWMQDLDVLNKRIKSHQISAVYLQKALKLAFIPEKNSQYKALDRMLLIAENLKKGLLKTPGSIRRSFKLSTSVVSLQENIQNQSSFFSKSLDAQKNSESRELFLSMVLNEYRLWFEDIIQNKEKIQMDLFIENNQLFLVHGSYILREVSANGNASLKDIEQSLVIKAHKNEKAMIGFNDWSDNRKAFNRMLKVMSVWIWMKNRKVVAHAVKAVA